MRYIHQGVLQSAEERKRFRHAPRFVPAGQSTQMIVGATPDSDKDILRLSSVLYQRPTMKRVYYSGFIPVTEYDNRLPALMQPPLVRMPILTSTWKSIRSSVGRCAIRSSSRSISIRQITRCFFAYPVSG